MALIWLPGCIMYDVIILFSHNCFLRIKSSNCEYMYWLCCIGCMFIYLHVFKVWHLSSNL